MQANNYDLFQCKKLTQKVVRLAIFCIKIFATFCPQNAWQIKMKDFLILFDDFYIVNFEQFCEKTICSEVER